MLPGQKGSPLQGRPSVLEPSQSLPGGAKDGAGLVHVLLRSSLSGLRPS